MITFLLILIIAIFDSIAETIRVPAVMKNSWFKKYIGHPWIDPEVSSTNKYKVNWFIRIFYVCFSDLYHTLRFLQRFLWMLLAIIYIYLTHYPNDFFLFAAWWVEYWFIFSVGLGTLKTK